MGFRKSTASISYLIQYLCLNTASQYSLSERMCALLWNYREIETCPRAALKTWSRYTSLVVSFVLQLFHNAYFDGLVVSDLYWIGKWCIGGCANSFLYVLVSLSQKDWVRKARVYFLLMYTTNLSELLIQNRFHDQDPDELQYQFGSTDMVRCLATSI